MQDDARVDGPITEGLRANAFAAPAFGLGGYGYTCEEFIVEGRATAYAVEPGSAVEPGNATEPGNAAESSGGIEPRSGPGPAGGLTPDGHWTVRPTRQAPFRTRILVMRPADPREFSGTVWLTWVNVTAGFEIGDITRQNLRDGDAIVYVSAQRTGIDGVPGAEGNGLRAWDPRRYGTLSHPGDDFSYDIFTAAARLVGRDRPRLPVDPLRGLDVHRVLGTGASQSAMRLTSYLNGVQPLAGALDGALLVANFGLATLLETPAGGADLQEPFGRPPVRIRGDLGIPVLLVSTETEAEYLHPARQPDTPTMRTWEVAGAAHAGAGHDSIVDVIATFTRDGLVLPSGSLGSTSGAVEAAAAPNSLDWLPVVSAARRSLVAWAADGTEPAHVPPIVIEGVPGRVQRDGHGNALGGARMPELEVPVATHRGTVEGADLMGSLFGSMRIFPAAKLRTLYPGRASYLTAFGAAVDRAVDAGYILPRDADTVRSSAARNAAELLPE